MKGKKLIVAGVFAAVVLVASAVLLVYISHVKKSEQLMNVNLYYFNGTENKIVTEKTSIPKTENKNEVVKEVEQAYKAGPRTSTLSSPFSDKLDFVITNNNENLKDTLYIDISDSFMDLKQTERLVCVGSLVYTFSDMGFINSVKLSVGGRDISGILNYGEALKTLNSENVVNNPVINPEKINRQEVVLYFLEGQGGKLAPEERSIEVKQSQTLEYQIVEQLVAGPTKDGLKSIIPQGTKIKDIKTEEGICYVNLSGDFVSKLGETPNGERLAIYSVVNSLTELTSVNKVQFLIDGEKVNTVSGHYDFSKTFERDETLIDNE